MEGLRGLTQSLTLGLSKPALQATLSLGSLGDRGHRAGALGSHYPFHLKCPLTGKPHPVQSATCCLPPPIPMWNNTTLEVLRQPQGRAAWDG